MVMAYKNPIPSIDDEQVGKEFLIRFSFDSYVSISEAVIGINEYIKKHNGKIDESAVKFAGNIKLRLAEKEEYV
jgi:hypothetical protein